MVPFRLAEPDVLIEYGRSAKERVFLKDEAYQIAARLGVHLSEHGGTGLGVIGALAGAGLRLSGNDGRFKGKFRMLTSHDVARVGDIKQLGVDGVRVLDGDALRAGELGDDQLVEVGNESKLVLAGGEAVLVVSPAEDGGFVPWAMVHFKALKELF